MPEFVHPLTQSDNRGDVMDGNGEILPFYGSQEELEEILNDARSSAYDEYETAMTPHSVEVILTDVQERRRQLQEYGARKQEIARKIGREYMPRLIRAGLKEGIDIEPYVGMLGGKDTVTPLDDLPDAEVIPFVSPTISHNNPVTIAERDLDWRERQYKD